MFETNPLKKQLYELVKLSKADFYQRCAKAQLGITPLQYVVLAVIQSGPTTLNAIAQQLNIKAPSLVPAIDALEKLRFLRRTSDITDRRKVQLVIAQKGRRLLKRVPFDDKTDALNTAFHRLSRAKQKQLLGLLAELSDYFLINT